MIRAFVTSIAALLALASPAQAFGSVFSVTAAWQAREPEPGKSATLVVTIAIDEGWHINSNSPLDEYLVPTEVRLSLAPGWRADPPEFPNHRLASFAFSDDPLAVFEEVVEVRVTVHAPTGGPGASFLVGVVEAQACDDKMCLAPEEISFAVSLSGTSPSAAGGQAVDRPGSPAPPVPSSSALAPGGIGASFGQKGLLLQLAIVFLAGLALNLTPCVYPLIPITIGFFLAQKEGSGRRTWLLAFTYVLGMSVTYSLLGVAAALTGRLFGAALQSPWVVGVIVVTLLALSASMFGLWELRVPAWAMRVSGGRSGLGGALIMGLVVGLVAAPCIGPFVLGLLTYVGQQQSVMLGFTLFLALSLGLGLPFLFLAVFSRTVDRLPNSGAWMVGVRQLFGVLLIALAGYFMQPFLPHPWSEGLLGGLLVLGALYLLLIARPGHEQPWVDRSMRLAAAVMLVVGVLYLPLGGREAGPELGWLPYDAEAVDAAIGSGQPVVLDFTADWCVPCRELDEKTFSAPEVVQRLSGFARFKVDLTRSNPATDAIRQRFGVAGAPTVAFFHRGEEVASERLVGFEPPERFVRRLDAITAE